MDKENLKIGDWLYTFSSSIMNKDKPFLDYSFVQITGETPKQWIINDGYCKVRKKDLKIIGTIYSFECMHIMTDETRKIKKQKDEWRESKWNYQKVEQ